MQESLIAWVLRNIWISIKLLLRYGLQAPEIGNRKRKRRNTNIVIINVDTHYVPVQPKEIGITQSFKCQFFSSYLPIPKKK